MKGLIKFFFRHQIFFLFIFFEILSFYFVIKYNQKQNQSFFNSANAVYASFYSKYANIIDYFNLAETNDKLVKQNAYLLNLAKKSYKNNFIQLKEINDSIYKQQYIVIPAKVINNSINKENNFLTLDKGFYQGISSGDAVISTNGVVGIVKDVSQNYSTVFSLLNTQIYISAKIKKNNYYGSIHWETDNYNVVKLKEMSYNVKLDIGDTISTSGYSAIFPENIDIGVIKDFKKEKGENFYNISVKLFNDFSKLRYVYVIKNLLKTEQKNLEQKEND